MSDSPPNLAAPEQVAPPPVEARGLAKAFGAKEVLRGVDLRVEPGEVVGLLGKNGAGKSTLLKCLLGLLRITGGAGRVYGDDAWDLSPATKGRLGYVPQEVVTYPWMTVAQVIAYTGAFYPRWNDKLADDLARRWDLPLGDRAGVLSAGQLQTLGLVLALGHEPDLLVLDEPVASLDPVARREFLRTLFDVVGDGRGERTVLFSSHITSDLERVATRVVMLQGGAVSLDSGIDDLKERVRRLRMTARDGEFPPALSRDLALAGVTNYTAQGRHATATALDYRPELVELVAAKLNADVAVDALNLEELFVELHDGRE
ncbi:MAG: ABC transporter ATP-binding protein [Lacipirellulaceae bacterium]